MEYTKYLPILYLILVILSFANIIPQSIILYGILAAIIGLLFIHTQKESKVKLNKYWLIIAFLLILTPKVIPYANNTIPLGYDVGIYQYGIENKIDTNWEKATFTPLFNVLMKFLNIFFPSTIILTVFLILFELLLGIAIYITVKEYFDKNTAILATLLFSLSLVQFKAFELLYYKNIIALSFLLFSFYFLKKKKYIHFTISSVILAGMHRPTFLIFALSFLAYTILNFKTDLKKNIISGIAIILLTLLVYIDRISISLIPGITDTVNLSIGGGTFINLLAYKHLILIAVPFLTIGVYYLIHNKRTNILLIWFLINLGIVVFKLFFFNRYIISLDIVLLIIAAIGLLRVIESDRVTGAICLLLIVGFLSYNIFGEAITAEPGIGMEELNDIKQLQNVEENAFVMATSSYYSPWVLGYSGRRTIAPGIFEENKWDFEEWSRFWDSDSETAIEMLKDYGRPLYIHVGGVGRFDTAKFENRCFEEVVKGRVWGVGC